MKKKGNLKEHARKSYYSKNGNANFKKISWK